MVLGSETLNLNVEAPRGAKAKFHVTLGHQTVMATAHFFCPLGGDQRVALNTRPPSHEILHP